MYNNGCECLLLYCMVAKFNPWRFGNRKVFLDEIQVPSPTYMVSELYVELPAGVVVSAMVVTAVRSIDRWAVVGAALCENANQIYVQLIVCLGRQVIIEWVFVCAPRCRSKYDCLSNRHAC